MTVACVEACWATLALGAAGVLMKLLKLLTC